MMENETTAERFAKLQVIPDPQASPPQTVNKPSIIFSKRLFVAVSLSVFNIHMCIIKDNVLMAIIEMTSKKNVTLENSTITKPAEFDWDSKTIALIISATLYGNLLSFVGGFFVNTFGGSVSCGVSSAICGILTMLMPFTLRLNFYLFIACRFIIGVFDGFFCSSILEVYSRWMPQNERSTLMSISMIGAYIGITVTSPFCGYLAFKYGWSTAFYVPGLITITLSIFWLLSVKNNPSEDKFITTHERLYILENTIDRSKKQITRVPPYKKFLTSLPIWALCMANVSISWGSTFSTTILPLFVKDVTQKNTKDVGIISAIPNSIGMLTFLTTGTLLDYWRNNTSIKTTTMHKMIIIPGLLGQTASFLVISFLCNFTLVIVNFIIIRILQACVVFTVQMIAVSIAPSDNSTVAGFTTFWFSISSIVCRAAMGFLITDHSQNEWNRFFLLTTAVLTFSAFTFYIYGSSEPQTWSIPTTRTSRENSNSSENLEELIN